MSTIVAAAGGGNWTTGGTWVGGIAPTAADDAQIPATAGNITIDSGAVCRSADFSTYTGTLTHTAAVTWTIGDATAGLSNIALRMVAGMTYTRNVACAISFVSTSATVQTITTGGITQTSWTINCASNGSYQLADACTLSSGSTLTLTQGTLDVNGQTCSWGLFNSNNSNTRTLTLGAANITLTGTAANVWNTDNTTNLTFSGASSTITFSGASGNFLSANNAGSELTFGTVIASSSADNKLNSNMSCTNYTRTGGTSKTGTFTINTGKSLTCSGIFAANGNSATNRLLTSSSTVGSAVTITAATVSCSNVDFMDITGAGAGSWDLSAITGGSGDCGGNSGITFTTAATQTYTGGTGNTSDITKWTSRVPLPQDNISYAGATGGTITQDMPRIGKDVDWTGASGSPTWNNTTSTSSYGNLTLATGVTYNTANTHAMHGRGSFSVTCNGATSTPRLVFGATTASDYTINDALIYAGTTSFQLNSGTLTANGNMTLAGPFAMNFGGGFTRTLNMGSGVWTFTTTAGTFWSNLATSLVTINPGTAEIKWNTATASTLTFAGGTLAGGNYPTLTHTVAGSTGQLNITGSNSFAAINFSDATNARTLAFTAATTTTIRNTNGFNVQGTSGKLMTVQSVTAATHTLSSTNRQSCDYLNIINSIATGGGSWYAGANSTDGTGNSGWIFAAAPPQVAGSPARQSLRNLQNLMSL